MIEPFDLPHDFIYRAKSSYSEYPKGGINAFLEKMYKVALQSGTLHIEKPLPAFNAAYYLATALNNVPNINLRNMNGIIDTHLDSCLSFSPFDHVADSDHMLCLWMAYAILYLQSNPSQEIKEYLFGFYNHLKWKMDNANEKEWSNYSFVSQFPQMIDECKESFHVDLYPSAKRVCNFESFDWDFLMNSFTKEDFEQFLSFYRTKEEQHEFLNAARQALKEPQYSSSADDLPF